MQMEQTECSETLAYEIQTPGNCPEESIQHTYSLTAPISVGLTPVFGFWNTIWKKEELGGLFDVFSKQQYTVSSAVT